MKTYIDGVRDAIEVAKMLKKEVHPAEIKVETAYRVGYNNALGEMVLHLEALIDHEYEKKITTEDNAI